MTSFFARKIDVVSRPNRFQPSKNSVTRYRIYCKSWNGEFSKKEIHEIMISNLIIIINEQASGKTIIFWKDHTTVFITILFILTTQVFDVEMTYYSIVYFFLSKKKIKRNCEISRLCHLFFFWKNSLMEGEKILILK